MQFQLDEHAEFRWSFKDIRFGCCLLFYFNIKEKQIFVDFELHLCKKGGNFPPLIFIIFKQSEVDQHNVSELKT